MLNSDDMVRSQLPDGIIWDELRLDIRELMRQGYSIHTSQRASSRSGTRLSTTSSGERS